jgi:hypothetical protein
MVAFQESLSRVQCVGYCDRDFAEARYTRSGPDLTLRMKFDQTSVAVLGLRR